MVLEVWVDFIHQLYFKLCEHCLIIKVLNLCKPCKCNLILDIFKQLEVRKFGARAGLEIRKNIGMSAVHIGHNLWLSVAKHGCPKMQN